MADVVEVDAATGETVERDFTPDEAAQRTADAEAARLADMEREADEQAKAAVRASALAKLAALGLSEDEARAVFGGA
jgi:hypothetical protein